MSNLIYTYEIHITAGSPYCVPETFYCTKKQVISTRRKSGHYKNLSLT